MEFFNLGRMLLEANKTEEDDCHDKCGQSSGNQHVPPLVIIIVATLGTCFLLVSYYAIIVKYCSFWNSTRRQPSRTEEHDTHEEFLDEEHRPVVDHPIWNIVTVGLAESIINSISICKYKNGDGLVEGNDCSICLSEFEEDESVRLLPKCSHAFHLPCIDTWLKSHTNCPLCRAPIVSAAATTGSTSPMPPELTDSSPQEETQTESSERENGASNMSGDGEGEGDGNVPTPIVNMVFRVPSDLTDKYWDQENEMQPMRRSFSMDFSPVRALANSVQVEVVGSSGFELERGKKSRGRSSQRVPISMKRSFSTGAKFLLSRQSRSQRSILPLVVLDTLNK